MGMRLLWTILFLLAGSVRAAPANPADGRTTMLFCAETARGCRPLAPEAAEGFARAIAQVEEELPQALRILLELPPGIHRLPAAWSFDGAVVLADERARPTHLLASWAERSPPVEIRIAALFALSQEPDGTLRAHLLATFPRGPDDIPRWPVRIDAAVLYGERGPPVLHLRLHGGGAETFLNVADHVVEFTPEPRLADLASAGYVMGTLYELGDRPPPELVLFDARWAQYFDDRLDAGPWVPVVTTVEDGHLVPACDRYPALYRRRLDELETEIRRGLADPHALLGEALAFDPLPPPRPLRARAVVAELVATRLLTALQVGWFAEAERDLRRLKAFLRLGNAAERALVTQVRADLLPVMEAVRAQAEASPCRLDGIEVGEVTSRVLYNGVRTRDRSGEAAPATR